MELNEGVDSFLLDVSPSGQEMHCAKMGVPGKEEVILFIVSNNKACTLVKSTPLEINRTVFEELKKQANWQYGNDDAT